MDSWEPWLPDDGDEWNLEDSAAGPTTSESIPVQRDAILLLIDAGASMVAASNPSDAEHMPPTAPSECTTSRVSVDVPSLISSRSMGGTSSAQGTGGSASQHGRRPAPKTPFRNALRCVVDLLKQKIIQNDKDFVGVCFYQTEKAKNDYSFQRIHSYYALGPPSGAQILRLEEFMDSAGTPESLFKHEVGHGIDDDSITPFRFQECLWNVHSMFSALAKSFAYKRVFVFTNDDDPIKGDATSLGQCLQRAADLANEHIAIELFAMEAAGQFDMSRFWGPLFDKMSASAPQPNGDESSSLESSVWFVDNDSALANGVRVKSYSQRKQATLGLKIGEGLELGMDLYYPVAPTKTMPYVWVDQNLKKMRKQVRYLCVDSGQELAQHQIGQYAEFGKDGQIPFTAEEVKKIKGLHPQGLRLIGFRSMDDFKPYWHSCPSSLLIPSGATVGRFAGSRMKLVALYKRMLERRKYALCYVTLREGSPSRLVALVPQKPSDELRDDTLASYEGFVMVLLPFAEDLRDLFVPRQSDLNETALEEGTRLARKFIQKLTFRDFRVEDFEDPFLQHHYESLYALATQKPLDQMPPVVDLIQPQTEVFNKHADLLKEFKEQTMGSSTTSTQVTGAKRKKSAVDEETLDDVALKKMVDDGSIQLLTVAQLKVILTKRKKPATGRKGDLLAHIENLFE